jgi:penicillin-binding protein 1A
MASAYTAFVNSGLWVQPSFIVRIEDKDGNVIEEFDSPKHDQVLSAEKAYIMTHLLERVVQRGTAFGMTGRFGIEGSVGGKTGTTQGPADGWFIGVTKNLVCATWVGADDPTVRVRTSALGQGSQMAMPVFGYFMSGIQKNPKIKYKANPFNIPPNFNPALFDCTKKADLDFDPSRTLEIQGLGD